MRGVLIMSVVGAAIAYAAVWAGVEHVWVAALLTFGITVVATLAAGYGHAAAIRGLLLSLWAVIALSFAGGDEPALEFSAAYLLGGVAAAAIMLVKTRLPGDVGRADAAAPPQSAPRALAEIVRSKLGVFALVRAVAVGLATVLGIEFFPDHPIWPALTVLIVLRAQPGEAFSIGALRTLGTLAGVLAAEAVISVANGASSVVVAAFLAAAFLMLALQKVNYAVFALFLTMVLVLSQELLGAAAAAAASDRFLATLLGPPSPSWGSGSGSGRCAATGPDRPRRPDASTDLASAGAPFDVGLPADPRRQVAERSRLGCGGLVSGGVWCGAQVRFEPCVDLHGGPASGPARDRLAVGKQRQRWHR